LSCILFLNGDKDGPNFIFNEIDKNRDQGDVVNSKKLTALFLLSFLSMGSGCNAQDSNATPVPSAPTASPAASTPDALPVVTPVVAAGQWFDGWYQGADGYAKAVEEYKRTNQSMVVYVSVGWCPYCRKFEKEVLSSPLVRDFLKDKIKVNINPESGQRENAIAAQYGVRGFPSFFLHPPQPARAVQLYTGVTPEDFIQFFKQALE
jgi:thioredoxin-related protein